MAFYTDTHTTTQSAWATRFNAAFAALKEARAKRRVFAQTLNELRSLSDRELADLGLARGQIRSVAYEAAYLAD